MRLNRKGITLMELVVVTALIGIGAVLLAPSVSNWFPTYRLKSGVRDVVSTMRLAQLKAVSANARHRVSFDVNANTYIVQRQNSGGVWVDDEEPLRTLPNGVQFSGTTFAGGMVEFLTNSQATDGNITLNNSKGATKQIRVAGLGGRIKVE